jgi:hypothetical protein
MGVLIMAVGKEIKSPVKIEEPTATAQRFLDQRSRAVKQLGILSPS